MTALNSFLPITFLILRGLVNPQKLLIDRNTGAMAAHYAAHHGHLKFLRWLADFVNQREENKNKNVNCHDVRDFYNCTLAHYATRQGHLPILMYCSDVLNIDLDVMDKFNFSALDYSICYKKLYCFIYIYYYRKNKNFNHQHLPMMAQTLCQRAAAVSGMPAPDDEATFHLVQLLVRTPSIASLIGPLLLANAINFGRADIVEQVYDNCFYLPKLARTEQGSDRAVLQSPMPDQLIAESLKSVEASSILQDVDKIQLKHILSGQQMKEAEAALAGPPLPHKLCRFFTWILITLFFYLMTCGVIMKEGAKRGLIEKVKQSMVLKDLSLFQSPLLVVLTFAALALSYILLFFFLFIFDPKKGLVMKRRFTRGAAVHILAK